MAGVFQPLTTLDEYPCVVTSLPIDYRRVGNGFVYQKNWPLAPIFNYHFLRVRLVYTT